jgi:hypothetical protein
MDGQAGQNTTSRAPRDPQEDERAVRHRQKRAETNSSTEPKKKKKKKNGTFATNLFSIRLGYAYLAALIFSWCTMFLISNSYYR